MSKHGNPARIRYIGHDWIANADTESIIDYLVTVKFGRRDPILDWPGLVYNLTSKEGKALLATPNGLAVAWMMVERAAALGRRQPKVHVFLGGMGQHCLLWDLVPVQWCGGNGWEEFFWSRESILLHDYDGYAAFCVFPASLI